MSHIRQLASQLKALGGAGLITMICALLTVTILALLVLFTLGESIPAFMNWTGASLTWENKWTAEQDKYGLYVLLTSSIMASIGALAISVPIGISAAIFIAEILPNWAKDIIKPLIELIGAMPSVLYGFIGLKVLVPLIQDLFDIYYGQTALTASIVLAIIVVPTIVSLSSEVISAVPIEYKEAALALGATKWQIIRHIVLPTAMPGIMASVILAFGRAIGETVAVVMVAGCSTELTKPFWNYLQPIYPMTAAIALGFGEAEIGGTAYHVYFAVGTILLAFAFLVNFLANLLMKKGGVRLRL
ncbi:MAG TPA: phosphate ABC transporter permease subunit PstC [Thermoprotei archaeon]|nr:phosphate ABC transporter permease subunit PstC [Thermoprotei archaeon]